MVKINSSHGLDSSVGLRHATCRTLLVRKIIHVMFKVC